MIRTDILCCWEEKRTTWRISSSFSPCLVSLQEESACKYSNPKWFLKYANKTSINSTADLLRILKQEAFILTASPWHLINLIESHFCLFSTQLILPTSLEMVGTLRKQKDLMYLIWANSYFNKYFLLLTIFPNIQFQLSLQKVESIW